MQVKHSHLSLDGFRVQAQERPIVPPFVVLVEVESCVPEGAVALHGDEDLLQQRIVGRVPVEVDLFLVDAFQHHSGFLLWKIHIYTEIYFSRQFLCFILSALCL